MKKALVLAVAAGGVVASMALPGTAQAAPAGNGATVVAQQDGVTTHTLCAFDDVWLAASGFAPNRGSVVASIQIVGSGVLFQAPIHLTDGSGTVDTGYPGPSFIGDKVRVRFQTGSSSHPVNNGSFSATIVDC
jgi:hypothetical protein